MRDYQTSETSRKNCFLLNSASKEIVKQSESFKLSKNLTKKSQSSETTPEYVPLNICQRFDLAIFDKMLLSKVMTNFSNFGVIFVNRLSKNTAYLHIAATRHLITFYKRIA